MTASIKRGDVVLVNFDPTIGAEVRKSRPAVVVSNDIGNQHSPLITIAPITSSIQRVYSFEVMIEAGQGGMPKASKVMAHQVRTVDKKRLQQKFGQLPPRLDAPGRCRPAPPLRPGIVPRMTPWQKTAKRVGRCENKWLQKLTRSTGIIIVVGDI